MDIFYGLRDRYDTPLIHSKEHFTRLRTRKRLTDLEAENLMDIEVKLKGMDQSAVDKKLKTIRRDELAEGLIPRGLQETLNLQSGVGKKIP